MLWCFLLQCFSDCWGWGRGSDEGRDASDREGGRGAGTFPYLSKCPVHEDGWEEPKDFLPREKAGCTQTRTAQNQKGKRKIMLGEIPQNGPFSSLMGSRLRTLSHHSLWGALKHLLSSKPHFIHMPHKCHLPDQYLK